MYRIYKVDAYEESKCWAMEMDEHTYMYIIIMTQKGVCQI